MGYKSHHHDKRLKRGVIGLTEEQLTWLRKEAHATKVSVSELVRRIIDAVMKAVK